MQVQLFSEKNDLTKERDYMEDLLLFRVYGAGRWYHSLREENVFIFHTSKLTNCTILLLHGRRTAANPCVVPFFSSEDYLCIFRNSMISPHGYLLNKLLYPLLLEYSIIVVNVQYVRYCTIVRLPFGVIVD
jgi:hypothetical protein